MMVLKHVVALIILSILFVIGMRYAHQGGQWIVHLHDWITTQLSELFTYGRTGSIARELIAILALPILAGLIPAIIYFMMRRQWSPVFMAIVWIVWALQIGVFAMTTATISPLSPNESSVSESTSTADQPATTGDTEKKE